MVFWFKQRGQEYEVSTAPDGEGFTDIISRVRRDNVRVIWRADWFRLDLPRPTQKLAAADARALAAALLDQADVDAATACGEPSTPPHVTAEQLLEHLQTEGFNGIGDGLYRDLGQPVAAYYYGFERALQDLQPPKEIPASATIYWSGYRDGKAAHPKLLDAGALTKEWGSRDHWRDHPIIPIVERTVRTDRDLLAAYTVDLMRFDIQPVYEPGYPPAEGETRKNQHHFYFRVTARFHERPLPRRMVEAWRSDPKDDGVPVSGPSLPFDSIGRRQTSPFFQWNRHLQGLYGGVNMGVMELVSSYDRPEDDASSALVETKQLVGSTVAALEEYRLEHPEVFVRDPVTVTFQQRAAELRHIGAKGPTQIPELTDEQVAKLGEQGPEARQSVHTWNEHARQGYERCIAELSLLEAQLRARGADPFDDGGWTPR